MTGNHILVNVMQDLVHGAAQPGQLDCIVGLCQGFHLRLKARSRERPSSRVILEKLDHPPLIVIEIRCGWGEDHDLGPG